MPTITAEDLVRREVHYCISGLVATLANRPDDGPRLRAAAGSELADLCWQAIELAMPIDDWEEAAREAGFIHYGPHPGAYTWYRLEDGRPTGPSYMTAHEACEANDLEPYQWEVYEHWIVSDWLADKLEEAGEKVDRDFAGLTVWARTTTGQAISMDSVIERIHADLVREA